MPLLASLALRIRFPWVGAPARVGFGEAGSHSPGCHLASSWFPRKTNNTFFSESKVGGARVVVLAREGGRAEDQRAGLQLRKFVCHREPSFAESWLERFPRWGTDLRGNRNTRILVGSLLQVQRRMAEGVISNHGSKPLTLDQTDKPPKSNTIAPPCFIRTSVRTVGKSTNIAWQECTAKREEKQKLLGQKGCVIWITGLSGSGKSTLACTLDHVLLKRGNLSHVLDGDNMRHGLNKNLGFCSNDRAENIRRIGEVAKLFADAGLICIASVISPYRKDRRICRELVEEGEFIEVFMNFPISLCEERDPKGLYKLARAGKIKGFTGVDDPYEPPLHCEVVMEPIDGRCATPEEMAAQIVSYLEERGILGPPRHRDTC